MTFIPTEEGESSFSRPTDIHNVQGSYHPALSSETHYQSTKIEVRFLVALITVHFLSLSAFIPCIFVWWGIPLVIVGSFIFGSLGISLGFHRMLTHRSVMFPNFLQRIWVLLGVCCLEGSPLWWACVHRMHHQYSDGNGDPHSPSSSFFYGHMQWIYTYDPRQQSLATYAKYIPDLVNDPFLRSLHRRHSWVFVYVAHAILIAAIGFVIGFLVADSRSTALLFGTQVFVWGVLVRTVYNWHITWLVNSAAHRWGYRSYETSDRSRNNFIVSLLTHGEGWHNNHHSSPSSCSQSHRWWEIDLTFTAVRLMELIGLAWDVVPIPAKHLNKPKIVNKP